MANVTLKTGLNQAESVHAGLNAALCRVSVSATTSAGVSVNASGAREYWASARTGADGRFELSGAPAGTISLRATAGDFLSGSTRSASGSVTIAEGQKEAEAEIVFDAVLDEAIAKHESIDAFLQQDILEQARVGESIQYLAHVLNESTLN